MSYSYSIPTWTKENRVLHDAICQARVTAESADTLRQLLFLNKEKFLMLLDNEAKDNTHRATLNSNTAYINRTSHNVSKDFVTKTLFLSDQLDINEYVAATLLMQATSEYSRVNSNAIDTAILLYHGERGYLLACLEAILKSAKDASISEQVRSVCNGFIADLVREKMSNGESYVFKILTTLDNLTKVINSLINTGSAIGQVPEAGSGKLGETISDLRIERLGDERVYIAQILYHITSLFDIDTQDKLTMLEMLEEAELSDPATSYMIITMVSVLSNDSKSDDMSISASTLKFINVFHQRIMTHGSKVPVIKAVIVLQWILYLSDPSRAHEAIGEGERTDEKIQELLEFAIATDVFRFMNEYLLYFQQANAKIDTERKLIKESAQDSTKTVDISDYHNFNADIRSDFQPFVIYELEKLGILVISTLFNTLQKLKYKEEDTNIPVQTPLTTDNALLSNGNSSNQCHDLEYFLTFLASVFRNRVNDGIVFWNREQDGLHHFLRWLLDVKVVTTVCAAFDFFASITTGDACAADMFHFFKAGMDTHLPASALFSWGKPLAALEFYADLLKDISEDAKATIPETEEKLLIKFLSILKQCVQYSKEARVAFWFEESFGAQRVLINILNCPTSTRLRAALFDVLTAFCSAWGGGIDDVGRRISYQMWTILEDSDMLRSKRIVSQDRSKGVYQQPGVLQELEAEKRSRVFVETLAILRLVGSAIHTQSKRDALISGFRRLPTSIPLDLGKHSKEPGSEPFISLVIDDIFISLPQQKYSFAEARWELTDACLIVMENSISAFDISQFESKQVKDSLDKELKGVEPNPFIENMLLNFLFHPGFQVVIRILSGGRVVSELFTVIEECAKRETKEVETMPYFRQCLVRSLRIVLKVLELQHTFCDILLPYITGFAKKKASSEFQLGKYMFTHLPSVVSMNKLILFHSHILHRISLLINYEDQEEVCFLSTKILNLLSTDREDTNASKDATVIQSTPSVSLPGLALNVTNVLSSSIDSDAIIFGISERLSISVPEITTCDDYGYDSNNIPFWLAKETLKNTYNYPVEFVPRLDTSVRLAILDLLLENTQQPQSPTLAEFLLGYNPDGNYLTKLQDTDSNQTTLICLHAILDMLRQGIDNPEDTEDAMMEDSVELTHLLIDTHPILAEKCYELIYKLCSKRSISTSTMRYLRNRENFCYKQFNNLSSRLEHNIQVESTAFPGTMVCSNGAVYKTDFFKLRSKLRQRAWLLQTIALELHTTVRMKQTNETSKLLELLYGRQDAASQDDMDTSDQPQASGSYTRYQQPLVKMLELVSSLEFTWVDGLVDTLSTFELKYFHLFEPASFKIENGYGCTLYNVPAMYKWLRDAQERQYADSPEKIDIDTEMGDILRWAMGQNHAKEIAHGKLQCLEAWKEIVTITLCECFDLIEPSTRQSIIYELLTLLLPTILRTKSHTASMLKSMNNVILTLVNILRTQDKLHPSSQQLPEEKLASIFTGIVNCICDNDTDIVVRGDMYSALTSFLMYVKDHNSSENIKQVQHFIVGKISDDKFPLLDIICSDAINAVDIWKTTAYIALDSLNTVALCAGSSAIQEFLIKKNFLQYTIEMIRSDDAALSNLLEQLDAPLLPLYIFEAKMSILLRFAMNPTGAKLLCDSNFFDVFGQCQFLKAQIQDPTTTEMNLESSMELIERREQLILPTLQVIVAILCTYEGKNQAVLNKAKIWARRQQSVLVNLLKYQSHHITLSLLEQLKLISAILYFISFQKEFATNFTNRGINQLHNTVLQFEMKEDLANSVIPTNNEERTWDKAPDITGQCSSLLQAKAAQYIKAIQGNINVYKSKW